MKKNILNITKRIGWMTGFTLFYFLVVRPLRVLYSKEIIYEGLLSSQNSIGNIISASHSPRQVVILYLSGGNEIVMLHIPQLGFFYLCGMVGLLFFKGGKSSYLGLTLFQVVVELLVLFLFWLGIHYTVAGFVVSDFLMTYLSPLGCLGFVVFVSMRK